MSLLRPLSWTGVLRFWAVRQAWSGVMETGKLGHVGVEGEVGGVGGVPPPLPLPVRVLGSNSPHGSSHAISPLFVLNI